MSANSEGNWRRWVYGIGWGIAALGFLYGLWSFLPSSGPTPEAPSPDQLRELASLPEEGRGAWLTKLRDRSKGKGANRQALILQAIPNEAPMVISSTLEADGDEEPTRWRSPWSTVNQALATGRLGAPVSLHSEHQGFRYLHTLIPFDSTQSRILLINDVDSGTPVGWWGLGAIGASSVLAVALFTQRE